MVKTLSQLDVRSNIRSFGCLSCYGFGEITPLETLGIDFVPGLLRGLILEY
jgi:hypothetical protein